MLRDTGLRQRHGIGGGAATAAAADTPASICPSHAEIIPM